MEKSKKPNRLWDKNFTGFAITTFAEYMSNAGMSFVLSLLVLDLTKSVLLYGTYLVLYYSASVFVPIFIGPFFEKYRKERVNAFSAIGSGIMYLIYLILFLKGINSMFFTFVLAIVTGVFHAVFSVGSNALMLDIVKKDNLQKAYSVFSGIEICSEVTIPIATILYKKIGMTPILVSCIFLFAITFVMLLTMIKVEREDCKETSSYTNELKGGLEFVWNNKAYLIICLAFLLCFVTAGIRRTVWLPYFNNMPGNAYLWYFGVSAAFSTGAFHASVLLYLLKTRAKHRFNIAVISFIVICAGMVAGLYFSNIAAVIISYLIGMSDGIFNNMKSTSIYAHLDEAQRGRFSGIFTAFINLGMVIGMAVSSIMANTLSLISVNTILGILVTILFIPLYLGKNRKIVRSIYNDESNTK